MVSRLPIRTQALIYRAIHQRFLPYMQLLYPKLSAALERQPLPRADNLFIVRYNAAGQRGLKLHMDETVLTFNCCLSARGDFTGGGTYFPAALADTESSATWLSPRRVDGLVIRPAPGVALLHNGNIRHAGCDIQSGERLILVGFYTHADFVRREEEPEQDGAGAEAEGVGEPQHAGVLGLC